MIFLSKYDLKTIRTSSRIWNQARCWIHKAKIYKLFIRQGQNFAKTSHGRTIFTLRLWLIIHYKNSTRYNKPSHSKFPKFNFRWKIDLKSRNKPLIRTKVNFLKFPEIPVFRSLKAHQCLPTIMYLQRMLYSIIQLFYRVE